MYHTPIALAAHTLHDTEAMTLHAWSRIQENHTLSNREGNNGMRLQLGDLNT